MCVSVTLSVCVGEGVFITQVCNGKLLRECQWVWVKVSE